MEASLSFLAFLSAAEQICSCGWQGRHEAWGAGVRVDLLEVEKVLLAHPAVAAAAAFLVQTAAAAGMHGNGKSAPSACAWLVSFPVSSFCWPFSKPRGAGALS